MLQDYFMTSERVKAEITEKLEPRQVKDLQKDWVCQRQMQI